MSDVTEQHSQADKRGAPLPHPPRGPGKGRRQPEVDWRADSKVFLFKKKKKVVRGSQWVFFFPPLRLLSSSPLPPLPFESFFFFFSPEFDRMADSTSVSINFFFFSSSFK